MMKIKIKKHSLFITMCIRVTDKLYGNLFRRCELHKLALNCVRTWGKILQKGTKNSRNNSNEDWKNNQGSAKTRPQVCGKGYSHFQNENLIQIVYELFFLFFCCFILLLELLDAFFQSSSLSPSSLFLHFHFFATRLSSFSVVESNHRM